MTNCAAASPSGTGTQTCNGNGSGALNNPTHASRTGEIFGFWQHLANAGLIEGNYTGIAGSGSPTDTVLGTNAPSSRISTAGWTAFASSYTGNGTFTDGDYANNLLFGVDDSTSHTYRPALKPEEAWSLDTKMDDGKPQQGKLWAIWWDQCSTAASSSDMNGNYDLALNTVFCALAFRNTF